MAENITMTFNMIESYFDFITVQNIYLKAGLVFLIFVFLAFIIRFIFTRLLQRLVKGTETDIDDRIIATAKGPMLLLIITLGIFISGRILGGHTRFGTFYTNFFITVMALQIFLVFAQIIMILVHGARETLGEKNVKVFDNKIFPFFEKILKFVLGIIYLFMFFKIWKIDLTPLLASAGVLGLAVAFAAQESIANVFGGISLFADKAYEIGDYVIVDDKYRGEVIDLGIRSTKLKTRDDVLVVVPNSVMANSKVINESGIHPKLRVRTDLDVAYDSDLEKVEAVLLDIAKKADYVEQKPAPRVRFRGFKDFSIHAQISVWVKRPALRGRVRSYIIKDIHKRFKKEGIEMPYPTREIFIKKMPKKQ